MLTNRQLSTIIAVAMPLCSLFAEGTTDSPSTSADIRYAVSANGVAATGDFAPYMIGSWNYGRTTAKNSFTLDLEAYHDLDRTKRFAWSAGVEIITGYNHKAHYSLYDVQADTWREHRVGQSAIWLQQLYGEIKYRGVLLTVGMKNQRSSLVDNALSSGDLVQSNNARPIPMVSAGFVDYQNIPLTNGWVQIDGCITYGKFIDNDYLRDQYNHYNSHLATGELYTYKRAYFRTKPSEPLSVTVGAQSAGHFGGVTNHYRNGKIISTVNNPQNLKAFWEMFIPGLDNGDGFVEGSHLGSWDFKARYRFKNGGELSGYFSWLWEDGSSMARRNKWDGLWGVEWHKGDGGYLTGAVLEYIDFRDQSGPIHYAPGDLPNPDITTEATGADDYYNNSSFNAHAHHGMAIGTPFALSPLYNRDGYPQFAQNRTRGFHAAATGNITPTWTWQAKVSYQVAAGEGRIGSPVTLHNTSAAIALAWHADNIMRGLQFGATMAVDAGDLRGDNFGALFTAKYSGNLSFKRHNR